MKLFRLTKNMRLKDSTFSEKEKRAIVQFIQKMFNINNDIIIVYVVDDDKKNVMKS